MTLITLLEEIKFEESIITIFKEIPPEKENLIQLKNKFLTKRNQLYTEDQQLSKEKQELYRENQELYRENQHLITEDQQLIIEKEKIIEEKINVNISKSHTINKVLNFIEEIILSSSEITIEHDFTGNEKKEVDYGKPYRDFMKDWINITTNIALHSLTPGSIMGELVANEINNEEINKNEVNKFCPLTCIIL